MQTVTRYIAFDGSEHHTVESCELRDEIITEVIKIMLPYGVPCTDNSFLYGKGYIQHTEETCEKVYIQLLQLYANKFIPPEIKDEDPMYYITEILSLPPDYKIFAIDMSWPLSVVEDKHNAEPISKALHRINCTNKYTFREYGTPYYRDYTPLNPDLDFELPKKFVSA